MTIPDFEFKHQSDPSDRSVTLAAIEVSREPLVIDFSSTYANNQESAVTVNAYAVDSNNEVDISGIVGNFVITDKTLPDGTFLFYEYQPMYDAVSSGIKVRDEDGDFVPHKIQYAYIDPSGSVLPDSAFLLRDNTQLDYDTLSGHSEIGIPTSGAPTFSSVANPTGAMGYATHTDSFTLGRLTFFEFSNDDLPPSGVIDFTFLSEADSMYRQTMSADDWSLTVGSGQIQLTVDGTATSTISISNDTWYRGRILYNPNNTTLQVSRESTTTSRTVAAAIDPSGFSIDADSFFVNNLTIWGGGAPAINWNEPPIAPRYHHSLRWKDFPVDSTAPYRIRILTEENAPARLTYDAQLPDGTIQQNRVEAMNFVPIYKESVTETQDWSLSNDSLLLTGPIADSDRIYLRPLFEGFISVDVVEDHVVVTNGSFKSSPYDTATGKYTYELLEYEDLMPFETDNQNIVYPKSLKEARFRGQVQSAYFIKVLPMEVFEGTYPHYIPPITEDIQKTVMAGVVTTVTGTVVNPTWRETRGIRVYVNGTQIPQSDIYGFDVAQGLIQLRVPVAADDVVEVTFLRRTAYFICNYPRLRPELVDGTSWRIYLRPNYPNHFLINSTDTLERLAYRALVNGSPSGSLKSCVSDQVVTEFEGTIRLADISLVPTITFSDARTFGGGLLPDSHFESSKDRENKHPSSIFYSDIARLMEEGTGDASTWIPWPSIFIRIPNSVRAQVESRFSSKDIALAYIKRTIEKHIALGTYYIIIDENNDLWDKPFPLVGPKKITINGLENPA